MFLKCFVNKVIMYLIIQKEKKKKKKTPPCNKEAINQITTIGHRPHSQYARNGISCLLIFP